LRRNRQADETQPDVVRAVAALLRQLQPPLGPEAEATRRLLLELATASHDPDSAEGGLALDALAALAVLGDGQAVPQLLRLLGHHDPLRRLRTVATLGSLLALAPAFGSDSPIAALCTTLRDDSDARVSSEAAWALGKLSAPLRPAMLANVASALRQSLDRRLTGGEPPRGLRVNALAALARLGQATVDDARWLGDPDPAVRANAVLLLGGLPSPSPGLQARLRGLASSDEDHRVRAAAERALGRLPLPPPMKRVHYLLMYQLDHDQRPLAEVRYSLTLADGLTRIGSSDRRGIAYEEQLPPGACEVELLTDEPR
jgi:HEAT repeat protein